MSGRGPADHAVVESKPLFCPSSLDLTTTIHPLAHYLPSPSPSHSSPTRLSRLAALLESCYFLWLLSTQQPLFIILPSVVSSSLLAPVSSQSSFMAPLTTVSILLPPQSHLRQSLTNSLANPSPAAPDPVYLSVAQSRPVTSSFAYSYSTSNINHAKSQNQGIHFHGDRNRRKQNSRPPRMFNRGPLNNTTNGKHPSSPSHFLLATPSALQSCCGGTITLLCSLGREKEAPGNRLSSLNTEKGGFTTSMIPLSRLPETEAMPDGVLPVSITAPFLTPFSLHIWRVLHQSPDNSFFFFQLSSKSLMPRCPR